MRVALAVASALLASAGASAQSAGQWRGPDHIWGASCGYCHGQGIGPEIRGRGLDVDAVRAIVRQGLPGMPNFHASEIDERELSALARWISVSPAPAKKAP